MTSETCLPRETLKRYLRGAVDVEQTDSIEAHLSGCTDCEQTILELEAEPDTLLVSVRDLKELPSQAKSALADSPSVVQRAVATARRLPGDTRVLAGPLQKPAQIGAYKLLEPLGQGGMGQVYKARHVSLDKPVAIKLLSTRTMHSGHIDLISRFEREMRAVGRLNHPAIVSATDAGEAEGVHYLVMELVDGMDLSRIARAMGPLAIADACELMRQVAIGLSHAHAEGIVHRDIKPSNIMLDASGRVKLLDFGLAQWNLWDQSTRELTTVGQLMGTLDYMAPEQAERTDGVDYRADLYALGATLFRLLTGRAPLAASPNMTLLEKVRMLGTQSAPSLSSLRIDAPTALVSLVASLLNRQPIDRPASAAHVAEALEPLCTGHDLHALLSEARSRVAHELSEEASAEPKPLHGALIPSGSSDTSSQSPPKRRTGWLVAAAMLPLLALAGVFVTLELQKGQLVIQSEVADVQVKVVRDGTVVDQLMIQPGAQATRLRADKYEIVIDAPSNQVVVDKDQFTLRNGQTVVAVVRQAPPKAISQKAEWSKTFDANAYLRDAGGLSSLDANKTPANSASTSRSPQTIENWMKVLETEADLGRKRSALLALAEILEPGDGPLVTKRLIEELKRWPIVAIEDAPGQAHPNVNVAAALKCLSACNEPADFVKLLDEQLLKGDRVLAKNCLAVLAQITGNDPFEPLSSQHNAEVLRYVVSNRFATGLLATFDRQQGQLWLKYLNRQLSSNAGSAAEYSTRAIQLAENHPSLGRLAVLQMNPYGFHGIEDLPSSKNEQAQQILEEAIAARALRILSGPATPEESAHAAYRLATTTSIVERMRPELLYHLSKRLGDISRDPERAFTPLPLRPYAAKNWNPTVTHSGQVWPASDDIRIKSDTAPLPFQHVRYTNYETLAYLALSKRLRLTQELDEQLVLLYRSCLEASKPVRAIFLARHELIQLPACGLEPEEERLAVPEPYRDLPCTAWTSLRVEQEISNLANEVFGLDLKIHQILLEEGIRFDMKLVDLDDDNRLSKEEAKNYYGSLPLEDKNGDGSYDFDELVASRKAYARKFDKEMANAVEEEKTPTPTKN